ncbi:MAG: acylphosphatase [Dehalococcoidia bacterium]|nr:acylphosphatase [Dehalococcoidia bacterium]
MSSQRPSPRSGLTEAAALNGTARGRVQGVGFRDFARREAVTLELRGWIRNEIDGGVSFHIEGRRANLDLFLARLERGPALGRVDEVVAEPAGVEGLQDFRIRG